MHDNWVRNYTQAIGKARELYRAYDDSEDDGELYLSGLADLISELYTVSIDTVLSQILDGS